MTYTQLKNVIMANSSYQFGVDDMGHVVHFHFGKKSRNILQSTNIH